MKDSQLRLLLAELSLEEKIGQLLQLDASFLSETEFSTGPAAQLGYTEKDMRHCGSLLNLRGAEEAKALQSRFMAEHPHHIPLLLMLDIVNGYETVFPIPLAQACSFDPDLMRKTCAATAEEGSYDGLHVTFAPMADTVSDCRWGRVMEACGEDPALNAAFAAASVRGFQGESLAQAGTLASCGKHFAGYGAVKAGSEYAAVDVGPLEFRSTHLPAYKACVDAGCRMMMSSFNTLDGIPATGNRKLLRDVLRGELGFEGMVISDYASVYELIAHGYARDTRQAAELAMTAGVDMDMVSPCYARELGELVRSGRIDMRLIDEAVWRVLTLKNELGLFEDPFRGADAAAFRRVKQEHRPLAREAAEQSFVLLKNEDVLPITSDRVAFTGPYAESKALFGAWSLFAKEEETVSIREGVRALGREAFFSVGSPLMEQGTHIWGFSADYEEPVRTPEEIEALLTEAEDIARRSDTVVLCLGEHRLCTGEGGSRTEPVLPAPQQKLLERVHEANPNIVLVLFSGRPLILTKLLPLCRGILQVWFPGSEGGNAIARVLYGEAEPGGKLAMTFPHRIGQCPMSYRCLSSGRPRTELDPASRFKNGYQDCENEPLFPFGFGLRYSTWEISDVSLDAGNAAESKLWELSFTVKNTGTRQSRNTVQLYLQDVCGSVCHPARELKAWRIVELSAGASRRMSFTIGEDLLAGVTADGSVRAEPGEFRLYLGFDSRAPQVGAIELI